MLCARCKDISTVFGTSQCKHFTIPFIPIGFVFVIFLFISSFTLADLNIIFYANIVSSNGAICFSDLQSNELHINYVIISI